MAIRPGGGIHYDPRVTTLGRHGPWIALVPLAAAQKLKTHSNFELIAEKPVQTGKRTKKIFILPVKAKSKFTLVFLKVCTLLNLYKHILAAQ